MSKMATKTEILRHKIAREVFGEVDDSDGIREYPTWEIFEKCLEQHKQIKDLEHRLANRIEPKFKIGQEVFIINKDYFFVKDYEVECHKIVGIEDKVDRKNNYVRWYTLTFDNTTWAKRYKFLEKDVFLTEEEAKAKLEELKNGN